MRKLILPALGIAIASPACAEPFAVACDGTETIKTLAPSPPETRTEAKRNIFVIDPTARTIAEWSDATQEATNICRFLDETHECRVEIGAKMIYMDEIAGGLDIDPALRLNRETGRIVYHNETFIDIRFEGICQKVPIPVADLSRNKF